MEKLITRIFAESVGKDRCAINEKSLAQLYAYDECKKNYRWARNLAIVFADSNNQKKFKIINFQQVPVYTKEPSKLSEFEDHRLLRNDPRKWFVYYSPILRTGDNCNGISVRTLNPWYFIYSSKTLKEAIEIYQTEGRKYEVLDKDFDFQFRAFIDTMLYADYLGYYPVRADR